MRTLYHFSPKTHFILSLNHKNQLKHMGTLGRLLLSAASPGDRGTPQGASDSTLTGLPGRPPLSALAGEGLPRADCPRATTVAQ